MIKLGETRAGSFHSSPGTRFFGLYLLHPASRDRAFFQQPFEPGSLPLRLGKVRFGLRQFKPQSCQVLWRGGKWNKGSYDFSLLHALSGDRGPVRR